MYHAPIGSSGCVWFPLDTLIVRGSPRFWILRNFIISILIVVFSKLYFWNSDVRVVESPNVQFFEIQTFDYHIYELRCLKCSSWRSFNFPSFECSNARDMFFHCLEIDVRVFEFKLSFSENRMFEFLIFELPISISMLEWSSFRVSCLSYLLTIHVISYISNNA